MRGRDRSGVVLGLVILALTGALAAQGPAKDPATDPEVIGAQRLFSAWAEGQLRFRGYPGMAVGVMSDQRLVWSRGFGLANLASKEGMTPQTNADLAALVEALQASLTEERARRARLEQELTAATERQAAAGAILSLISASPTDVQPVFEAIAESALRLFEAWSTSVFRYDNGLIHAVVARGGLPGSSEAFVAHVGDVATQAIRERIKLVGIDVILVHRLLKNPVGIPEYVLLSEELYNIGEESLPAPAHEVTPELEGFGTVRAYYLDVGELDGAEEPPPQPAWPGRLGRTAVAAGLGLPYQLGLRRSRRDATPVVE